MEREINKAMTAPLTAQISRDEVGITLYCPELNIHTCGKIEGEAKRKFIDAVVEYWHFLRTHDFKEESPYKEHLELLGNEVLPALADASLRSPRLRISVEQVLKALAAGTPQEELLKEYPELEPEDIQAALAYAAGLVAEEKVLPIKAG